MRCQMKECRRPSDGPTSVRFMLVDTCELAEVAPFTVDGERDVERLTVRPLDQRDDDLLKRKNFAWGVAWESFLPDG
jgi:hypothetical protein